MADTFPLATPARRLGWALEHLLYDVRILHADRVPRSGAVIVVSNHTGFLDGPVVFCSAPRTLRFLVKRSFFTSVWGAVLRHTGQIPIDQHSADRAALAAARGALMAGDGVGIFPEGTRGRGDVEAAQQGAAWLALQTGARIIPAATLGTRGSGAGRESWPRPRGPIRVVFGEPFAVTIPDGVPGRDKLRIATEQLRARLAAHVESAVGETGLALPVDAPAPLE